MLMEVLVALAVLVIVVTPVTALLVQGVEVQARARCQTAAVFLAVEGLEEVRSYGFCGAAGGEESAVAGVEGFVRNVDVVLVDGAGCCGRVKEVAVTVAWQERGGRQEVRLVSCLGRR